jgi:MarR-like DNA-binding transcriptional regulator SgrR of sgrS sRNA
MGTLNEVHMQMQTVASAIGLEININKTKYMRTKKGNEIIMSDITLNGQTFEEVDNFKNLGALITSQLESELAMHSFVCLFTISVHNVQKF